MKYLFDMSRITKNAIQGIPNSNKEQIRYMKFTHMIYYKSWLFICIALLSCTIHKASNAQEINQIMKSPKYYWGQGFDNNARIADRLAIENFIESLSTIIKDKFFQVSKDQGISLEEYTKKALKTYANTSFKEMQVKSDEQAKDVLTIRYVEKENLKSLFYRRETAIRDYFEMAETATKENRISDALQKYYWSLLLLRSHPDNQTLQIKQNGANVLLIDYLPEKINYIFKKLTFKVNDIKSNPKESSSMVNLDVRFDSIPVENLQFEYQRNGKWENTCCKNGKGVVLIDELNSKKSDSIRIRVEYNFESDAGIDKELTEIFQNVRIPVFKSAEFVVNISDSKRNAAVSEFIPKIEIQNITRGTENPDEIGNRITQIIKSIENKSLGSVKSFFTDSGWEDMNYLINYGNARLISQEYNLKVIKINNEYVVRKIPMYFKFKTNNKEFVEDLVFYFNDNLKVTGISFSISDVAINDINNKKEEWGSTQDKYQLIQFIENYKTAYCFKHLDYIEKVFDDNALIIVGRRLEDAPTIEDANLIKLYNKDQIEYIKKSKSDYVKSLSMVFKSNEYINVYFENNQVKKVAGTDKTYGIQIAQYYTSVNYSDKGYLFLMIDLNDSINPKIYVRTWQPQKNADGSVIGLQDFHF